MDRSTHLLKIRDNCLRLDNYACIEVIGKGCSGIVLRALHNETKEDVALKVINPEKLDCLEMSHFYTEVNLLSLVDHINVVKMLDYSESALCVNQQKQKMNVSFLALEYLQKGDLFAYLSKTGPLPESLCRYLFHQLVDGLEYLHAKGIYHRDIKPENLMFDPQFTLKIVDFGFSTTESVGRSTVGTPTYMVPEIFKSVRFIF